MLIILHVVVSKKNKHKHWRRSSQHNLSHRLYYVGLIKCPDVVKCPVKIKLLYPFLLLCLCVHACVHVHARVWSHFHVTASQQLWRQFGLCYFQDVLIYVLPLTDADTIGRVVGLTVSAVICCLSQCLNYSMVCLLRRRLSIWKKTSKCTQLKITNSFNI